MCRELGNCNVDENNVESVWSNYRNRLMKTTNEVCGMSKKRNQRKKTWWWDDVVSDVVLEKRKWWMAWKKGGSNDQYLIAKRKARKAVCDAKKRSDEHTGSRSHDKNFIYKLA